MNSGMRANFEPVSLRWAVVVPSSVGGTAGFIPFHGFQTDGEHYAFHFAGVRRHVCAAWRRTPSRKARGLGIPAEGKPEGKWRSKSTRNPNALSRRIAA